jgi:hypothetical protein
MPRLVAVLLVPLLACHSYQRVRIPPGKDPAGEACFARCTAGAGGSDQDRYACVAACPGAIKADGDCVVPEASHRPLPMCVRAERADAGPGILAAIGIVAVILIGLDALLSAALRD